MRIAIIAVLMLTACGTWSNEDLEYLYALPTKAELKSQLGTASTSQGLRRDPLSVGEDSPVYAQTKAQSDAFNTFIDNVLTNLESIRQFPPTTRLDNSRIWGPFRDDKNKGFEVKVEITRVDGSNGTKYTWSIQLRPIGGEYFTVAGGEFLPTVTLRKGSGAFFFDALTANTNLMQTGKPGDPDRIDFRYRTDTDPIIVELDFTFGGVKNVGYGFNGYADKSAVLAYTVSGQTDPNATKVSALAGWDSTTAGVMIYTILEGNYVGANVKQCWDASQKVSYVKESWAGGQELGNPADCVALKDLLSL